MLKLRSMMEDVAEKLLGRFLPQIEAEAMCSYWEERNVYTGCCPSDACGYLVQKRECNPCVGWCGEWQNSHYVCWGRCCFWA
jgi:hypothetical protein